MLPICLILFIFSSFLVSGSEVSIDDTQFIVSEIIGNKNTADTFLSLYIEEGRFYSTDGNINWRLQIWQDVINNSIKNDLYILVLGFKKYYQLWMILQEKVMMVQMKMFIITL